jgi:hypothetical protein
MEEFKMKITLKMASTLLILILVCAALIGCAKKPLTKTQINRAEFITDNLIDGISKHEYKTFSTDFDSNMLDQMKEADFEALTEQLDRTIGAYQSRELKESRRILNAGTELFLFKYLATYDKEPGDVTITLYLTEINDKYMIAGFSFDSPELQETKS